MRILLAPMEGLLDHLLRDTLTQGGSGIDACVTEFIRISSSLLPAETLPIPCRSNMERYQRKKAQSRRS